MEITFVVFILSGCSLAATSGQDGDGPPNEQYRQCYCEITCERLGEPCAVTFDLSCRSWQCKQGYARIPSLDGKGLCVPENQCPVRPNRPKPVKDPRCEENEIYAACTCDRKCATLGQPCNEIYTTDCYSCQCAPNYARLTDPPTLGPSCVRIPHCVY